MYMKIYIIITEFYKNKSIFLEWMLFWLRKLSLTEILIKIVWSYNCFKCLIEIMTLLIQPIISCVKVWLCFIQATTACLMLWLCLLIVITMSDRCNYNFYVFKVKFDFFKHFDKPAISDKALILKVIKNNVKVVSCYNIEHLPHSLDKYWYMN
jgi:hypothetical protein